MISLILYMHLNLFFIESFREIILNIAGNKYNTKGYNKPVKKLEKES